MPSLQTSCKDPRNPREREESKVRGTCDWDRARNLYAVGIFLLRGYEPRMLILLQTTSGENWWKARREHQRSDMLRVNKNMLLACQVASFVHPWITISEEQRRLACRYRHCLSKSNICSQERSTRPLIAEGTACMLCFLDIYSFIHRFWFWL